MDIVAQLYRIETVCNLVQFELNREGPTDFNMTRRLIEFIRH